MKLNKKLITIFVLFILSLGTYWFFRQQNKPAPGILVINTSKTVYSPGETILFQMASLDAKGATICNSRLRLEITGPNQKIPTVLYTPSAAPSPKKSIFNFFKKLETISGTIVTTSTCSPTNNVTNEPDYITRFKPETSGNYTIKLINMDTKKTTTSSFTVSEKSEALTIERSGATRLNPFKSDRYPMSITVTANQDYSGELVETIPASYKLAWYGNAKVTGNTLTWQINLKKGETKTLTYNYTPEKLSPALFTFGPLKTSSQIENTQWFIASDGACTSAASGNWNTAATWGVGCGTGGTAQVPTSADTATVKGGHTVTVDVNSAVASAVALGDGTNAIAVLSFNANTVLTISNGITIGQGSGSRKGSIDMTNGGTLKIGTTVTITAAGTFTVGSGTIEYSGGAQTINLSYFNPYNNLTLSGTNVKTAATTPTVNGILSMEGTATITVTTGVVTYGTNATLQYNTTTGRTASTEEWITPFVATGGIIIKSTGAIVPPGSFQMGNNTNSPLNINSGATFSPGTNTITLHGDLINNGTITLAATPWTIAGTNATQSIGGFTTTGTVSMTKTSGTATFVAAGSTTGNVSGAALTINGTGGTLNLGTSLTHTFTGDVSLTNGTLDGGSSTLNVNNVSATAWTGTGSNFTRSTSTVVMGGAGNQTINTTTTFNNLTLGTSGVKTIAGSTTTTVNGILSMEGTATATLTGTLTYGSASTLQYNTSTNRSAGAEWLATLPAAGSTTGGINVINSATITLNGDKVVSGPVAIGGTATLTTDVSNNRALTATTINIGGTATLLANNSTITLTGTTGPLFTKSGTFTQGGSTVSVTSASGTPTLLSGSPTFHILTVNSTATVINSGAAFTIENAAGAALNITNGVFNVTHTITGPGTGNGTLTVSSGKTLCLGGGTANTSATCDTSPTSTTAVTLPTFQTYTLTGSNVRYVSDADVSLSVLPTYNNLVFAPQLTADHIYTLATGTTTINGSFTINPTATSTTKTLSVKMAGDITVATTGTTTIQGTTTGVSTLIMHPVGTDYNLSTGLLKVDTGGTLDGTNTTTSTVTITGVSTAPELFIKTGAFTAGGSTVIFNGNGTSNITSGAITFNNLSFTPSATSDYTFGSANAITINGDFLIQPSGSQLLTVNMGNNITVAANKTTTISRSSTATSKLVTGTGNPTLSSGNITVATGGTLDGTGSTSNIALTATSGTPLSLSGDNFTEGSTTVTYIPGSGTANTVTSTTYYNVTFNHTGTTFSLTTGGITVTNDLTISAGVLDTVNSSNFPITVGRNWTNSVGTGGFTARSGTVTFNTTTTASITGATNFYNFTAATAGKTIKFGDGTTFGISGLLTLTGAAGPNYVTLNSVTGGTTTWTINFQGTSSVTYADVYNSACNSPSPQIDATDGTSHNGGNNDSCWNFAVTPTNTPSPIPSPTYSPAPIPSSNWHFNESYGGSANDGQNNKQLSLSNTTWTASDLCISGSCLYFDGTTSKVSKSYSADSEFDPDTNSFSITVWFRHPSASVATQNTLLARYSSGGYKIYMNTSGQMCFGIDSDATWTPSDQICSSTAYNDSTWHHLSAVKSGTTSISLYIDGLNAAQKNLSDTGSLSGSSPTLYLGVDSTGNTNYWAGFIDEVRYFNTALTQNQIYADKTDRSGIGGVSANFAPDNSYLSNGLVGYWKMDENTGTTSTDLSGNSDTMTLTNSPTWGTGKYGSGVTMNGTNSYLTTTTNKDILDMRTGSLSAFMWEKVTKSASNDRILIYNGAGNASDTGYILQPDHTTGKMQLWIAGSGAFIVNGLTGNTDITDGNWHFVGFTWNPQSGAKLYADGQLDGSAVASTSVNIDSGNPTQLGGYSTTGYTSNGTIDETRFYNRELSSAEVQEIYTWAPGPAGWWKMDENTGSTANDSSGNGNAGTLVNNAKFKQGKFGSSVLLNGIDSTVDLGKNATAVQMGSTKSFTVEAWIYLTDGTVEQSIISNKCGYSTVCIGYELMLFGNSDICAYVSDGTNASEACSTDPITSAVANHWEHWAFTFDRSSGVVTLFRNGLDASATRVTAGSPIGSVNANPMCMRIGMRGANETPCTPPSVVDPFHGSIDDVRIYDYIRTQGQIIEDMNGGHPAPGSPVGSALGFWHFNEGYGDTVNNSGNCGSTCALTRSGTTKPAWSGNGKLGQALNFGGSNAYLAAASDVSQFKITSDLTLSAWINLANTSSQHDIICKYTGTASTSAYCLTVNTSGKLQMLVVNATGPTIVTTTGLTTLVTSTWYHVAGVFSAGNSVSLYVNGNLDFTNTSSIPTTLQNPTTILDIGGENAGSNLMNGLIDDAAVYSSALSASQIKALDNLNSADVLGTTSTDSSGNASWSSSNSYCPPGQGTTCVGPVGEWKMDESTGTTTYDSSTNGLNGVLNSSPAWTRGKYGSGISLNPLAGGTQNVSISDAGGALGTSTLTVEAWVNLRSLSPSSVVGGDTIESYILSRGNNTSIAYSLSYYNDGSSGFEFCVNHDSGTSACAASGSVPALNTWYHLVGTWSQPNISLYVNGNFKQTTTFNNTMYTGATANYIGRSNFSSYDGYINGIVDNVSIYNYVRTPAQIAWDYNRGNPQWYLKFNESAGNTANDSGPIGANATWQGSPTADTTAANCKIGNCLDLSTTSKYVSTGNFSPLSATGTTGINKASWGGWYYLTSTANSLTLFEKATELQISTDSTGHPTCATYNGTNFTANIVTANTALSTSTWHHVFCTYDGSFINLYLNGQLISSAAKSATFTAANSAAYVGRASGGTGNITGRVDDQYIFNYPLTSTQIKTLFNNGAVQFVQ